MNNNNNEPRKSSGLWKTAIVAVVSAVIGGGVAYGGFSLANRNNGQSTDTALTTQSKTSGSTKVSNVTVNASTQMTKAFDKNKAAVVSVINLQKQNSNSSSDDPFSSLFGSGSSGRSSKGSSDSSSSDSLAEYSEGSGLIYSKSDGKAYIVTNNHVVSGSDSLQVIMSDGTKLTAKLVGTDELTDLAVLSIDASKVSSVATFGNSDSINLGNPSLPLARL
ncbi:serine protease, DegP/HtrA, do-like [Agrilactobacillus composti DSM 18527 = JCM 14202]|nr:serine protease, DegP/HtrA, do-like [Agrilactobacillus composti DSM 18527 = JCM 14202]